MAVQVAPFKKPVIVVENGTSVVAEPEAGVGVPLVHATLTLTLAALAGENVLFTVRVAWLVLVNVQEALTGSAASTTEAVAVLPTKVQLVPDPDANTYPLTDVSVIV